MNPRGRFATHTVSNQPPPLAPHDALAADLALDEALARWGRPGLAAAGGRLAEIGALAGSEQAREWAFDAHRHPPRLVTHDRYGERADEVEFHPSWHHLLGRAVGWGLHGAPWTSGEATPHLARAAGFYLWSQAEAGHGCPVSMTYAAVPALRAEESLAAAWTPLLSSPAYDPGLRPAAGKRGALAGMAMTEKQGGSDVRSNTTVADPGGADGEYVLTGHKWFCSAPMSDVFLVLAQAPGGLTCFVLPRVLPDGTRNAVRLVRLKDKLGNRSNASAEVEFEGALASRLGPEGRGVATILAMVNATRLDCVLGSAALMRRAVGEASWHAAHRRAFGSSLADQPAMANVLADLAVEQEAATTLAMRLAAATDAAEADPGERALLRIALPAAKYYVCKRAPSVAAEALECLGGNGYVEESGMPMLFRESPLNSVWEGAGSVQALDVLRALRREPDALTAWLGEIAPARGADPRLDHAVEDLLTSLADLSEPEYSARRLAERIAVVFQGALLVRYAPAEVADAFCASRLGPGGCVTFGTLPRGTDAAAIIDRAAPAPLPGRDGL
ncbi:acyl-CoA dehydrogenase family protein [Actinopolymorpha rutila]|uniref:Putative acyl-CoA dehydrogenase n=1 Tax=Actinopolymorpha rutila TaxID=446787 RepID=A0A852ZCI0_9ACTN|nr:acyl-CoA dehydrogenase family protein [Actinopolymorpha rutila]NYH90624.1 putative acyl-CoA dehydrogenase [Actinopolymorpha rutila]